MSNFSLPVTRRLLDELIAGAMATGVGGLGGEEPAGLLVGIAGLGVVMIRAARERRQETGMLRAMAAGFALPWGGLTVSVLPPQATSLRATTWPAARAAEV